MLKQLRTICMLQDTRNRYGGASPFEYAKYFPKVVPTPFPSHPSFVIKIARNLYFYEPLSFGDGIYGWLLSFRFVVAECTWCKILKLYLEVTNKVKLRIYSDLFFMK